MSLHLSLISSAGEEPTLCSADFKWPPSWRLSTSRAPSGQDSEKNRMHLTRAGKRKSMSRPQTPNKAHDCASSIGTAVWDTCSVVARRPRTLMTAAYVLPCLCHLFLPPICRCEQG